MRKKTLLSWSSGKDSAWALHVLLQDPAVEVVGLFSVINEKYDRVTMHSTRPELLDLQAKAVGLPLYLISLPDPCTLEQSDVIMGRFTAECALWGIACMAFGDLFLEDIRQYRESRFAGTGIDPLFPLWKIPTDQLAEEMLDQGLKAYVSCVDLQKVSASFAGREWTRALLETLPTGVDPCGENGEIHTIVTDGPMFNKPVPVTVGEIVEREGFAFADIVPLRSGEP